MTVITVFVIWFGLGVILTPVTYWYARKRHAVKFPNMEMSEGGHGYAIGAAATGIMAGPLGPVSVRRCKPQTLTPLP